MSDNSSLAWNWGGKAAEHPRIIDKKLIVPLNYDSQKTAGERRQNFEKKSRFLGKFFVSRSWNCHYGKIKLNFLCKQQFKENSFTSDPDGNGTAIYQNDQLYIIIKTC